MSGVEKRLEKIEKLLLEVMEKISRIENKLKLAGLDSPEIEVSHILLTALSIPPVLALEASKRVMQILKNMNVSDDISRAIIESLSTCEELSISEITRRVKSIRGKASRRIVSEKLKRLESMGVVSSMRMPNRVLYVLNQCKDKGKI